MSSVRCRGRGRARAHTATVQQNNRIGWIKIMQQLSAATAVWSVVG